MGGFRRLGDPFASTPKRLGGPNRQDGFLFNQFASFEAGALTPNPTGFDSVAGVVGNLAVSAAAALRGSFGLAVTIAGAGSDSHGVLSGPNGETILTTEFVFDPNSLTMANADVFNLVRAISPGTGGLAFILSLIQTGANQLLLLQGRTDAGANLFSSQEILSDQEHYISLLWRAASAPGANDGCYRGWIDGAQLMSIENIDNDTHNVTSLQYGAPANVDAGTNGTIYFDDIGWSNQLR